MKFEELGLDQTILQALAAAGFTEATPVQQRTITEAVKHQRDVTVQSQTGTGKTAAFLLPFFQLRLENPRFKDAKAMVLAPTRELAVQIYEEAQLLGKDLGLKFGCVYGGVGYGPQETMLRDGVDLLVGTPGRLLDFVGSKKIHPKEFSFVVIDEADRLLDMGFYPDMKKLFKMLCPREERLTMLLSATISSRVSELSWEYMNDPVEILIESDNVTVDAIDQRLFHVARDEKIAFVLGILKTEKPSTAIIFCNTKRAAEELSKRLEINGIPAAYIMGDLPQSKRLRIIQDLKDKKVGVLVATDVAARGLHIDALDLVINFDLPDDAENYVHRIGRTARAGAKGIAISLACERYVYNLEAIEKYIGGKVPTGLMSDDLLVDDASRGMRIRLDAWDEEDKRAGPGGRHGGSRGPAEHRPTDHRGGHGRGTGADRPRPVTPHPGGHPGPHRPAVGPKPPARPHVPRSEPNYTRPPTVKPPLQSAGIEQRLDYYRRKYGEDFIASPELIERLKREEAAGIGAAPKAAKSPPTKQPSGKSSGHHPARSSPQRPGTPKKDQATVKSAPAGGPPQSGLVAWLKGLFRPKKSPN